jgi:uncharacterized membrane protein YphA (DoxX/SURF4 family)
MKLITTIARVIVGVLFIFSGLVKAIDPAGLTYKMQEFFEAWASSGYFPTLMHTLNEYALISSIVMISLEVVLGVALLIGVQKKLTIWLLFVLVLFFTFLTSYVLFSGKIRACGCFGDCIPLTPVQTFSKDIILLILVLILFAGQKYIKPFLNIKINRAIIIASIICIGYIQWYVLNYLPIKDCLPYKKGNNLLELRKMPANAIPDKYDYVFVYEKNGAKKDFNVSALPDSTWTFVERKQTLIEKGKNNIPLINDFLLFKSDSIYIYQKGEEQVEYTAANLPDSTWELIETKFDKQDVTESVLSQQGDYYLLFIRDFKNTDKWLTDFYTFYTSNINKAKFYIVTPYYEEATKLFNNGKNSVGIDVLVCDATAIKTAARVDPTLFKMNGPIVKEKWSWALFESISDN